MAWAKTNGYFGIFISLIYSVTLLASERNLTTPKETELVEIPVSHVFIPPKGYDNNDQVEALIEGQLPNPCFTVANAKAEPVSGTNAFRIRQFAWRSWSGNCGTGDLIDDPVPFTAVAALGILPTDGYRLVYETPWESSAVRGFNVEKAMSLTVDNFNYANIRGVDIEERYREGEEVTVTLRGKLPSVVFELAAVDVQIEGDVIVVLPKLQKRNPVVCPTVDLAIKREISLGKLKAGTYALHIRSRGGRAVYGIVNVTVGEE